MAVDSILFKAQEMLITSLVSPKGCTIMEVFGNEERSTSSNSCTCEYELGYTTFNKLPTFGSRFFHGLELLDLKTLARVIAVVMLRDEQ